MKILKELRFWGQTTWWLSAILVVFATFPNVLEYSYLQYSKIGHDSSYYIFWSIFPSWFYLSALGLITFKLGCLLNYRMKEQAVSDTAKVKEMRRNKP